MKVGKKQKSILNSEYCMYASAEAERKYLFKHENADVKKRLYCRILRTTIPQNWAKITMIFHILFNRVCSMKRGEKGKSLRNSEYCMFAPAKARTKLVFQT